MATPGGLPPGGSDRPPDRPDDERQGPSNVPETPIPATRCCAKCKAVKPMVQFEPVYEKTKTSGGGKGWVAQCAECRGFVINEQTGVLRKRDASDMMSAAQAPRMYAGSLGRPNITPRQLLQGLAQGRYSPAQPTIAYPPGTVQTAFNHPQPAYLQHYASYTPGVQFQGQMAGHYQQGPPILPAPGHPTGHAPGTYQPAFGFYGPTYPQQFFNYAPPAPMIQTAAQFPFIHPAQAEYEQARSIHSPGYQQYSLRAPPMMGNAQQGVSDSPLQRMTTRPPPFQMETPSQRDQRITDATMTPTTRRQSRPQTLRPAVPDEPASASADREYFSCLRCKVPRPHPQMQAPDKYDICFYCAQNIEGSDLNNEVKWCRKSGHPISRDQFVDADGVEHPIACARCRFQAETPFRPSHAHPTPFTGSSVTIGRSQGSGRPGQAERRRGEAREALLTTTDPPLVPFERLRLAPALSDRDEEFLRAFDSAVQGDVMEECIRCKEQWFDMQLNDARVCRRCHGRDRLKSEEQPYLMSRQNRMDPGEVPDLPQLNVIEELLIARVHVSMEIYQVRGQQYRYKGHVINFLRDTARLHRKLPVLPKNINAILLRPTNADANTDKQFAKEFTVRRGVVHMWLLHLKSHHPGYANIEIDEQTLNLLPVEDAILDQLLTESYAEPPNDNRAQGHNEDEDHPESFAVPNIPDARVVNGVQQTAEEAAFDESPLSEWDRSRPLLSLAFPSLFPRGEADFSLPRERTVTYADYIDHLLKYKDGRFARHPRFRFVVFNTLMRQQVGQKSSFFLKRRSNDNPLTIEDIRGALDADPNDPASQSLLNSIIRTSGSLRGTRPYWVGRRNHLDSFVRALGKPDLFVTCTAADLQWDSLMRLMPDWDTYRTLPPDQKLRLARENLRDNPHIAAAHFQRRFKFLLKYVLVPKFAVRDYWIRFEWQERGSSHVHFFLWCDEMNLAIRSQASRNEFARVWGLHVTALNPDPDRTTATGAINAGPEMTNTLDNLATIVNGVQRHACSKEYCLRPMRNARPGDPLTCRFYFPREVHNDPRVSLSRNLGVYTYIAPCNDATLNPFNRLLSMAWKANTDITPCTTLVAVLRYIAKDCSRDQGKTKSYVDIMKSILPRISSEQPTLSFVARTMNKLIGERDWSAQEVSHLMLNLPLQESSRTVITLDCRLRTEQVDNLSNEEFNRKGLSVWDKYERRKPELDDETLFTYLTRYDLQHGGDARLLSRETDRRLINYFPKYHSESDHPSYPDFCRIKVLLHHPFRACPPCSPEHPFVFPDGTPCTSWSDAYLYCQSNSACQHDNDYLELPERYAGDEADDEHEAQLSNLAAELPNVNRDLQSDDPDSLGERKLDCDYDWRPHIDRYRYRHPGILLGKQWWKNVKATDAAVLDVSTQSTGRQSTLNARQRLIFDMLVNHYTSALQGATSGQLLVNVDGPAGTGKSFLIQAISSKLQTMARSASPGVNPVKSPVVRLAPTGSASHAISGQTLHSFFQLPASGPFYKLPPTQLPALMSKLQQIRYLIIDEKSMIGLKTLHYIDQRLKQALSTDLRFGGLSIVLFGDFFQLTPIGERPLFQTTGQTVSDAVAGQQAYHAFTRTVVLDEVVRQQGDTPEQLAFREALSALRVGRVQRDHWHTLASRVKSTLTEQEVQDFDEGLHLFFTNRAVNQHNSDKLRDLQKPVIAIDATHDSIASQSVDPKDVRNLQSVLRVSLGCRVMLLENVWTENGLVNGRQGFLYDIVWPARTVNPYKEPPSCMLVAFEGLPRSAPELFQHEGKKVLPISRSRATFSRGGKEGWREQFPLTVSYGLSVHKAQGMTLGKAVITLDKEFSPGLTYVAVSRVKTLSGLMFDEPIDLEQLQKLGRTETALMREADSARRVHQEVAPEEDDRPSSHHPTSAIANLSSDFERLYSEQGREDEARQRTNVQYSDHPSESQLQGPFGVDGLNVHGIDQEGRDLTARKEYGKKIAMDVALGEALQKGLYGLEAFDYAEKQTRGAGLMYEQEQRTLFLANHQIEEEEDLYGLTPRYRLLSGALPGRPDLGEDFALPAADANVAGSQTEGEDQNAEMEYDDLD